MKGNGVERNSDQYDRRETGRHSDQHGRQVEKVSTIEEKLVGTAISMVNKWRNGSSVSMLRMKNGRANGRKE